MIESESIKALHERATTGEKLSPEEAAILQNWYDEQDRTEDLSINRLDGVSDSALRHEQLRDSLAYVSQSVAEVANLTKQNETLRRENESLRRTVESRLTEKAA